MVWNKLTTLPKRDTWAITGATQKFNIVIQRNPLDGICSCFRETTEGYFRFQSASPAVILPRPIKSPIHSPSSRTTERNTSGPWEWRRRWRHHNRIAPAFGPEGQVDAGVARAADELLGADHPLVGGREDAADAGHVHLVHLPAALQVRDHVRALLPDAELADAHDVIPLVVAVLLPGREHGQAQDRGQHQEPEDESSSGAHL